MILKFREIEVFWAVYKSQSVKAASRLLNVSQPAVSMMLKSAEDRFGVKLFERTGGRMKPTPEARALFASTDNVFVELQEFERQLMRIREGRVGFVRVAATPTLAAAFLHPALAAFRDQHSDVRVVVRTVPTEQTLDMVAQGRVDVGITYGPTHHPGTQVEDLGIAQVACVIRREHRLAAKSLVTPRDLTGESVVTYRPDTPLGREVEKTLRATGAELDIAVEATALTAAYLADVGFGVALIDPFILNGGLFRHLTVRPFEPIIGARVQILTPKEEPISLVCQDFIGHVRRAVPRQFSFTIPILAPDGQAPEPGETRSTSTGNRLAESSTSRR